MRFEVILEKDKGGLSVRIEKRKATMTTKVLGLRIEEMAKEDAFTTMGISMWALGLKE